MKGIIAMAAKEFTDWHEQRIKDNEDRSKKNESKIIELEKTDVGIKTQLENVCKNVNALTKVLWALASAIFITLIAEIVKSFI